MLKPRTVHNTNSPNFIKLDWADLNYILEWSQYASTSDEKDDGGLTDDELVTKDRVKLMKQLMEEKREMALKGRE